MQTLIYRGAELLIIVAVLIGADLAAGIIKINIILIIVIISIIVNLKF